MPITGPVNRHKGAPLTVTYSQTSPTTATAVTMAGMKNGKFDRGISMKTDQGDGDLYATTVFNDALNPTQTFEATQAYAALSIDPATLGTLAYKIADARGGITTALGGYQFTMTNAYLMTHDIANQYRDFSKSQVAFGAISTDGTTNPVTIASL